MREKRELIRRYCLFIFGIWFNALGVAFLTRSMLGTGPSTCIPYVASLKLKMTMGECNFIFNLLLLILQIIILGKQFRKHQLLQIPVSFVYSAFIDIAMMYVVKSNTTYYFVALLFVVIGCIFRGLGTSCQVLADVVMLAPEATTKALADVTGKAFSLWKVIGDAVMTAVAAVMAIVFLGRVEGVREGTLMTVLLVGPVCHFFINRLRFTSYYLENDGEFVYETKFKLQQGKRIVVTVTSEAGSGGRVIAKLLGEKMGIPVYNKEIISLVAEETGYSKDYVAKYDEKLFSSSVDRFIRTNYSYPYTDDEISRKLFETHKRVITKLADEQDCVIVGHCSNYILDDYPGALHFHISANPINRINYIMDKYDLSEQDAYDKIMNQDNDASQYYLYFTGRDWKDASTYHMSINSSLFGYEGTADIIEKAVKKEYIDLSDISIREVIKKYRLN